MNPKAIVGLVRSRLAYVRDWPEVAELRGDTGYPGNERVFDLSALLVDENREVRSDWATVGRKLPFPLFAVVGSGHGVFIVCGDEKGFYAYCYTAPLPLVVVQFTLDGAKVVGVTRRTIDEEPERVGIQDPRVKTFAEVAGMLITLVEQACENTRHMVSYTLTRAERRSASKEGGAEPSALDATVIHRVCLNLVEKRAVEHRRGATVVPTPKRLHEVRSHDRHLKSGAVVRVRSHTRGKRGGVLMPRVYDVREGWTKFGKGSITLSERPHGSGAPLGDGSGE